MYAIQSQANDQEQLTSKNLFYNQFMVVSISRAIEKMASSSTSFLHATLRGQHKLPKVGVDAKPLYATMATFLFTGELLQQANLVGIRPHYIGFHEYGVRKNGYFLLFIMNLTLCSEAVWDHKIADYRNVLPPEERKRINEKEDEEYDNRTYSYT
jgi:hypothetical protein